MKRLEKGAQNLATVRKCGHIYVPYRVLKSDDIGKYADVMYDDSTDAVRVLVITGDDIKGRAVVYETSGVSVHIKPVYSQLGWLPQQRIYKVPLVIKEDSFEFILKKDLHQSI